MPIDASRAPSVIGDNDPDMTIFQQPWWLEAVSDNRYQTVRVGDDNGFIWWPYVQKRWCGFSLITAPAMTHILGPVIRLADSKTVSRTRQRRKLIESALAQLPGADGLQFVLAPGTQDALDLQLAGFEIGVRFTYRLSTEGPIDGLWDGLRDTTRNKVRRGQQNFVIRQDMSLMAFYAFYEANLARRGRTNHHDEALYRRLDEALARRDRHRILTAVDRATGRIAAAVLLIWDARTLYHFRATHDSTVPLPGASSLLAWESILLAASLGLTFDSDSFHERAGALFIEGFGVTPAQRLVVSQRSFPLKAAQMICNRVPPGVLPVPRLRF